LIKINSASSFKGAGSIKNMAKKRAKKAKKSVKKAKKAKKGGKKHRR